MNQKDRVAVLRRAWGVDEELPCAGARVAFLGRTLVPRNKSAVM